MLAVDFLRKYQSLTDLADGNLGSGSHAPHQLANTVHETQLRTASLGRFRKKRVIAEGAQITVVSRKLVVTAALSALLAMAGLQTARAGDDRAGWFQSLLVPGTRISCCDIADCRRTDAVRRAGNWWVLIDRNWRQVPQFSVLDHPTSIDGAAYVCVGLPAASIGMRDPPIQCFVPPNWSS